METSCLTVGSTRCMPCMYCRRHTRCKGNFELSKGKKCKGKNLTEFERHLLKVHLGKTDKFLKTLRKKFEKDLKARTKHIDMLLKLHHNSNIEKSPRFPEVIKQTHTSEVHTIQTSTSEVHTVPTQLYTTPSQSYTTTPPFIKVDPTPHNQTVHHISELVVQGTPYNTYIKHNIKHNTQFFDFRTTPVNHPCNNEHVLDSTEPLPDLKDIVWGLEIGEPRKGRERKRAKKEAIDEGFQYEQLGVTRGKLEKDSDQLGGMGFRSEKVNSVTKVITPQNYELNTPNNSPRPYE